MSIQNYIAIFEDLNYHCYVRKHRFQTITRFVSDLKSKIKCAMITSYHDVDTLEDAFNFALKNRCDFQRVTYCQSLKAVL